MKRIQFYSLVVMIIFIVVSNLWPGVTGKIAGRVIDAETGEPLPGVNVYLEGTTLGASTDLDGYYVILNVSPGTYNIIASNIGYQDQKVTGIKVSIDFTTTIDFKMRTTVYELSEAVTVVATREMVRKDLTSTVSIVGADEISQMPVEDINNVLQLQAGIIKDVDGEIHVREEDQVKSHIWLTEFLLQIRFLEKMR